MHELNHRMKNTLSVIQSIVTQSLRGASTVEEATATLQDRISAYSRAHDILMHENWSSIDLRTVVASAISSLGLEGSPRLLSSGPDVELDPQAALAISLVLHELGTNARKYGALSNVEGLITMRWSVVKEAGTPVVEATWAESGAKGRRPEQKRLWIEADQRQPRKFWGTHCRLSGNRIGRQTKSAIGEIATTASRAGVVWLTGKTFPGSGTPL